MTTGTKDLDLRFGATGQKTGLGHTKIWNGSDRVALPIRVRHPGYHSHLIRRGSSSAPYVLPPYRVHNASVSNSADLQEHPYTVTAASEASVRIVNSVGTQLFFGNQGSANVPGITILIVSDGLTANEQIDCVNRLRTRLVGSGFNPSQFIAGVPESLDMIYHSATKIRSAYGLVRHGRFGQAQRVLFAGTRFAANKQRTLHAKDAANAWLELSYGWRPLVQDAFEAATFLESATSRPRVSTTRVQVSRPIIFKSTSDPGVAYASSKGTHSYRIKAIATESLSGAYLSGLTDPASTIWEALPFSFVADWFIPIGNYLEARAFASAVSGTFVISDVKSFMADGVKLSAPPRSISGRYFMRKTVLVRTVSSSIGVALPTFKPLSTVPGWTRAANALSLLVQRHGSSAE